ncbi:MAG: FAD-binding oxidoreductase [Actinobacteria bacterium]|nr:FAD-binding oxidoreductase [Actinomycetota bacterium]
MTTTLTGFIPDLRAALRGEVDDSDRRRAEYSTDASNYRVVPQVVAYPWDAADVAAALEVARQHEVPITARGAGTSIAGNAVGTGLVLDFTRHMNRIVALDPGARTAVVEPGVVMAALQDAAAPHGLRFGPDPSTWTRASLGGMIGNNACGPRAVAYGRTADNVVALDILDGTGRELHAARDLAVVPGLGELVEANLATIRTNFGRFKRQVSGYSLEHLLPENGTHLARMLSGSEGTLGVITAATLDLVPIPSQPVLVVLGYPDMPTAADAVPTLLAHRPLAIEGIDARLIDVVRRRRGEDAVPPLPDGAGWLLIEVGGPDAASAMDAARALAADGATSSVTIHPAGPEATALWRIRADGAGLGGRTPAGDPAWPGWEDAAVPPEHLGGYLRDFEALLDAHGLDGLLYGHFGDGCVHVRVDFPIRDASGIPATMAFLHEAADLTVAHGGSLSGEHGDGRARSELLPKMYPPEALALFGQVKSLFDPANALNPGVITAPEPLDANLRRPAARRTGSRGFSFAHDDHDFTTAVHRCTGVGKCRADNSGAGGFMCPSYQATKDEKDATRGRARVLQEVTNGSLLYRWNSEEVRESLDLCLACKACSSDCPAGVDMAKYRSEVLYRSWKGRIRPVTHYLLGMLPLWGRLVTAVPGLAQIANLAFRFRPLTKAVLKVGGMDTRREMVSFETAPLAPWWERRAKERAEAAVAEDAAGEGMGRPVLLWADSFSHTLDSGPAKAMVELLEAAGYDVMLAPADACCGLTWITTGQLDVAKRKQRHLLDLLGPLAVNGIPIVGVEPSCTAVLRDDMVDLLPDDPRALAVSRVTFTLAELLTHPDFGPGDRWTPPDLTGVEVVAQPHCHHYSVMGWDADAALLRGAGAELTILTGCCGLAGNFGMEAGHYEVSVAVAENSLLPALREKPDAVYLADGFSCRTQAAQLADRRGVHLAELLVRGRP